MATITATDSTGAPSTPTTFSLSVNASSGYTFAYFISPAGDDSHAGTLAAPWSITALNTKGSTYAGTAVGLLPGLYQGGTVSGVFTSFYSRMMGAASNTVNPLSPAGGSTSSVPTIIASCNSSGVYARGTAVLDASNPQSAAVSTVMQGSMVVLPANAILDGVEIRNHNGGGVNFTGSNSTAQNCEVHALIINCSAFNPSAVGFGANTSGCLLYNTLIHDCQTPNLIKATVTNITATGCTLVSPATWPYDTDSFSSINFADTLQRIHLITTTNGSSTITFPAGTAITGTPSGSVYFGLADDYPWGAAGTYMSSVGTAASPNVVEGCTIWRASWNGQKASNTNFIKYLRTYMSIGNFAQIPGDNILGQVYPWAAPGAMRGFCLPVNGVGATISMDHCILVGQFYALQVIASGDSEANNGTVQLTNNTFYCPPGSSYYTPGFYYASAQANPGTLIGYNNLFGKAAPFSVYAASGGTVYGTVTLDHNVYSGQTFSQQNVSYLGSGGGNLAYWQSTYSYDANSNDLGSTNPFLNTPADGDIATFAVNPAVAAAYTGGRSGSIAGAVDGTAGRNGASCGANFSPAALTFPRTGGVYIAGSVQTSFGTSTFQQQVAKLNIAVIGLYPGWTGGGFTFNSAAAAVKGYNPNTKLVPYHNIMELEPGVGSSGSAYSPIYNAANAAGANWFLRNPWPAGPIVDADGNSQSGLNQTTFTQVVSGQNYLAWRAAWTAANEYASNWDGTYTDNVFYQPRVSADYSQSGSSQTASAAAQNWRNGYASYFPQLRSYLPPQAIVLGNVADWLSGHAITGLSGLLNGGVMESILGGSTSTENGGWSAMMAQYAIVMGACVAPNYSIFAQDGSATNYAGMRYGLCSCLLDNAYYYHSNNGSYDTVELYDEFNFNLGAPAAGPNNLTNGTYSNGGITVYQNGVWRRDFVNGISVVNPRGNGAQTITFEVDVWALRGTQDSTTNNAAHYPAGTSISMPDSGVAGTGGWGQIFSRTAT
jgi:putative glycosyl hydrolase-like family 15 (GHL15) protein